MATHCPFERVGVFIKPSAAHVEEENFTIHHMDGNGW
ncbi:unnamed protein product [Cylicostephanus goldi]|uniref:Uncharacterized protein n=1 Tax=Cylicostephanus goldi TaxID=71465 RepID=A0A3P7NVL9_CYLGO|nr:unnamed protein product [Cylicostephanus goldi]